MRPQGGDELNRIEAGKNYGWPVITHGIDYNNQPIKEGIVEKAGMEQPRYYWNPVIAPSGMAFYQGNQFLGLERQHLRGWPGRPIARPAAHGLEDQQGHRRGTAAARAGGACAHPRRTLWSGRHDLRADGFESAGYGQAAQNHAEEISYSKPRRRPTAAC